ncbi:MAG: NADH-quinone oxidoreductase subunit NuoE [Firmicutes bacterium]|nr:NADH-quinone oxidoreductase subunit NuoE [Bacillota bacterium]
MEQTKLAVSEAPEKIEIEKILEKYKLKKGALIPALQEIQSYYGYLPEKAMEDVARIFNLPLTQVYGVATFYAQFHLKPRGRNIVRLCMGTACHVRGSALIMEKIEKELGLRPGQTTSDMRFTFEPVACLGACGQAPVMMVNDDTHGRLTPVEALSVLETYK